MSGDIYIAAAGALASEYRMQLIANNLANANTVGFKMDQGRFRLIDPAELPGQTVGTTEDLAASRAHLFWNNFSMYTDYSGGALKQTDNAFDLALVGKGFFCVQAPDGVHYTRKGDFTLNADGVLVTRNGLPVLGEGGEITVDSSENPQKYARFVVDTQGNVSVGGTQVGRLRIVDFEQPGRLSKVGDTRFKADGIGPVELEREAVKISQGFVELSNVDSVKMMTEMIEVLRGYESYQKIIQNADETYSQAINQVGSLNG
jgi:flagellar basal-body rod protein FlgG